jgi:hypothetical protein
MNALLNSLEVYRHRVEAEFRVLCQNPEWAEAAIHLADAFVGCLIRLCNYTHCVSPNGSTTPVLEVSQAIQKDMEEHFKRLTGRIYQSEVTRNLQQRRTNASKFLNQVMEGCHDGPGSEGEPRQEGEADTGPPLPRPDAGL